VTRAGTITPLMALMSRHARDPNRKPDPPPDLIEFIRHYGGYAKVTVEGWREWERIKAEWEARNHNPAGALKDQEEDGPR
jgi:hypothetical protein